MQQVTLGQHETLIDTRAIDTNSSGIQKFTGCTFALGYLGPQQQVDHW